MLNFKKEYFKLEAGRTKYSTSFSDLMTSCEVYGKKQNPITSTAFTYLIPKDYYKYNAGNIDFTNYPNGIWNDYTDIKIVKSEPYFDLDFNFNNVGDITPQNLNNMFTKIKTAILRAEKDIIKSQVFIDSGIPKQLGLPDLPKGCIWYMEEDGITTYPITTLFEKYQELLEEIYIDSNNKIIESFKNEIIEAAQELELKLKKILDEYIETDGYLKLENYATSKIERVKSEIDSYITQKLPKLKGDAGYSISKIKFKKSITTGNEYEVYREDGSIIGNIVAPVGPRGIQGIKGEQGNPGITIPLTTGQFAMGVENDGNLYIYYNEGDTPPNYLIENGKLYMIINENERRN